MKKEKRKKKKEKKKKKITLDTRKRGLSFQFTPIPTSIHNSFFVVEPARIAATLIKLDPYENRK